MDTARIDHSEADQTAGNVAAWGIAARLTGLWQQFPSDGKGMLAIVDQAIVSGTAFATAAIIGRLTSPGELGLYYLVLSVLLIASGVQDQLIMAPYAIYSKRQRNSGLAGYAGSVWMHHFILTALAAGGLGAALIVCLATGQTQFIPLLWALLAAGPLLLLRDGIRRFAFANLHVKSVLPLDLVLAVVQLGGLVVLAYFGQLSVVSIFAVVGAACAVASLFWYFLARPQVRFVNEQIIPDWRTNWAFGKWALRSFLVGSTTPYVMLWILTAAAGTAAAGVLGACTTIVGVTNVILVGVSNVLTPQAAHAFASGGPSKLRSVLYRAAAFLGLALGGFCLIAALIGGWLVVLVFGERYDGSGPILFALAASALMNALGMVAGNGLWAIDRPRANFLADLCWMVVTLVVAAALVLPFGALGAALAMLAGTSTAAVVRSLTLGRLLTSSDAQGELAAGSALPI